ncbi:reverse transcriptase domain, reverse transcriptase zinc-binding domain protein [Tanacetum coccineum]
MKKGQAKVSWDSLCTPKHEGGLGIHIIDDFNVALMATHIWSILTNRESLWVKWVHMYKLKGRSFWDVHCKGDVRILLDWFFLLMTQSITLSLMVFDDGLLTGYLGSRLAQIKVPLLLDDIDDVILWRDRDGVLRPFLVAYVWDTIRTRAVIVKLYDVVWFPHRIPHYAIHLWLVFKQKLKTQDRPRQWDVGSSIDLNLLRCPLCDLVPDSHDHLFFECAFSSQVWSKVRVLCGMDTILPRLIDITSFINPISKGKMLISILSRLVLAASSYYIWLERNGRLFKKKTLSLD